MEDTQVKSMEHGERDHALNLYLREIGRISLVTRGEEKELGHLVQRGDKKALKRLIEGNLRFVVSIAKKFRNPRLSLLDLINEGNLGLIEAAKRFDPERGVRFVTYAVWWIRQSILQALAVQGYPVKLPLKKANLKQRIKRREQTLKQEFSRRPSRAEIADSLQEEQKTIENVLRATKVSFSLEVLTLEEDRKTLRLLAQMTQNYRSEDAVISSILADQVRTLMTKLTSREAEVLHLHFGLGPDGDRMTLEQIGNSWGMTKEGVRQIECKATTKLRMHCDQVCFSSR